LRTMTSLATSGGCGVLIRVSRSTSRTVASG
jgi:hypothetical protein